jgi:hypothetical protein
MKTRQTDTMDPIVGHALDLLVPTKQIRDRRDWREILDESRDYPIQHSRKRSSDLVRIRTSFRRPVLASVLIVLLGLMITIPALAVTRQWIFGNPPGSALVTPDLTVATGTTADGVQWSLQAAKTIGGGFCMKVLVAGSGDIGGTCVPNVDEYTANGSAQASKQYVGWSIVSSDKIALIFGPVAKGVATVDVRLRTGDVIPTNIEPAPSGLGVSGSFYVASIQGPDAAEAVIAKSDTGAVLQDLSTTM